MREPSTISPSTARPAGPAEVAPIGLREQRRLNRLEMSREQVLDVAERLFGDNGYRSTSLEQVALGSEFSVGAVHKLFNGKKGLLTAVIARRFDEMRVSIIDILTQSMSGLDEVLALCQYYTDYYAAHPSLGRLHLRVYSAGMEPNPEFADYAPAARGGLELLAGAIKQGQREGTIRRGRPIWLATIVQGLIHYDHVFSYSRQAPAHRQDLLSLVRSAIAVEAAPSSASRAE